MAAYVAAHRTGSGAYDFAIGPEIPQGPRAVRDAARAAAREQVGAYVDAGVTWWIEGAYDRDELRAVAAGGPPLSAG